MRSVAQRRLERRVTAQAQLVFQEISKERLVAIARVRIRVPVDERQTRAQEFEDAERIRQSEQGNDGEIEFGQHGRCEEKVALGCTEPVEHLFGEILEY